MDEINNHFFITERKVIRNEKGDIFHVMRDDFENYFGFGEVYFTEILHGQVKGWKMHKKMILNLVVPRGEVCFELFSSKMDSPVKVLLSEYDYKQLTVFPGVWVAFSGIGSGRNLICNFANILHDPVESVNAPYGTLPL